MYSSALLCSSLLFVFFSVSECEGDFIRHEGEYQTPQVFKVWFNIQENEPCCLEDVNPESRS